MFSRLEKNQVIENDSPCRIVLISTLPFRYYNAVIDEISSNGHVSVTFSNYGSTELTTLEQLKLPGQVFQASFCIPNIHLVNVHLTYFGILQEATKIKAKTSLI